mgnify:CR=1 FL=1
MPVSANSRYARLPILRVQGRVAVGQRPIPSGDETPTIEHRLIAGETLDLLAKRYYGRADLWWRIADANPGRFPLDYRPGDVVLVPLGPSVTTRPNGRGAP